MNPVFLIGLIPAFVAMQWFPLPRWRLFAALIAIGLIITGTDLPAIAGLPHGDKSSAASRKEFIGGVLIGVGAGYFARWMRVVASPYRIPR